MVAADNVFLAFIEPERLFAHFGLPPRIGP